MEVLNILDIAQSEASTDACRRRYHRSAVKWQVKMAREDGTSIVGVVRDVSAYGIFIQFAQVPPEISAGSTLDLQIALPQPGAVVQTPANVCWCGFSAKYNRWGIGVELQSRCQAIADYFGCDGVIDRMNHSPSEQQWDMLTPATGHECAPAAVQSPAMLVSLDPSAEGFTYQLRRDAVIGRGSIATIRIDDPLMSRAHASIKVNADGTHIIADLGSRNGTQVNGKTISSCTLKDGDTVSCGEHAVFRFIHQTQLQKRLQESQRMETVGRLAFGAVHDVCNLLTVVNMVAEIAASRDTDEKNKEDLKIISNAASSANNIMNHLMGLARTSDTEHCRIDVSKLADKVAQLCHHAFPKNIEVEVDLQDSLLAMGNPGQLEQVLLNLCMNARDAIGNNEGKLRVQGTLQSTGSEGDRLILAISDTGCGMDKATQERAFEPYFTTKAEGEGTGIGLAVAQKLIRRMQGEMSLTSHPGKGSTFTISLPAAP